MSTSTQSTTELNVHSPARWQQSRVRKATHDALISPFGLTVAALGFGALVGALILLLAS